MTDEEPLFSVPLLCCLISVDNGFTAYVRSATWYCLVTENSFDIIALHGWEIDLGFAF